MKTSKHYIFALFVIVLRWSFRLIHVQRRKGCLVGITPLKQAFAYVWLHNPFIAKGLYYNRVFIRRFYRDLHVIQNNLNNLKKSGYVITDMIEMTYQQPQMRDDFIDEMQVDGTKLSLQKCEKIASLNF